MHLAARYGHDYYGNDGVQDSPLEAKATLKGHWYQLWLPVRWDGVGTTLEGCTQC